MGTKFELTRGGEIVVAADITGTTGEGSDCEEN